MASSLFNSVIKVPDSTLSQKLTSVNPNSKDLKVVNSVSLPEGHNPRPTLAAADTQMADYYRYGKQGNLAPFVINRDTGTITPVNASLSHYSIVPAKVEEFEDRPATIRVIGKTSANGKDQDLVPPYSKFILQGVQESNNERSQIIETFGDFYVFFHGKRPQVYSYTGTLINTQTYNWVQDFEFYYENYLRGTKCIENNARLFLTYGGRQVEAFMLNASTNTTADFEFGVSLTFQLLIIDRKVLGLSLDFGQVVQGGKLVPNRSLLSVQNTSLTDLSNAYGVAKNVLLGDTPPYQSVIPRPGDAGNLSAQFGVVLTPSPSGGIKVG